MEGGKTPSGQPALKNVFLSSNQDTASEALLDGALGLINGDVDNRAGSGVCICDHDSAKRSASGQIGDYDNTRP
jgi:hypothetical protein